MTAPPRLGVWLFGTCLLIASAKAGERRLMLAVEVNGQPVELVSEFIERDGALFSRASELRELGLRVEAADDVLVPLAGLPGLGARLDERRQVLALTAEAAALEPRQISRRSGALPPVTPPGWAAMLNYDVIGTSVAGVTAGAAEPELRLISPYGTLATDGVAYFGRTGQPDPLRRLDSSWTYAETDGMRGWRLGDMVAGGLAWSRPVRLGGGQVASDFAMRPDLVRYASPSFAGQAAVPSTVEVLVNGVRQLSQPVPPGPFEIRSLPVLTGTGDVVVAVRDQLGQQQLTTLPFFASTQLLAEGLSAYSLEAGKVRLGFGTAASDYYSWAASGTLRHGVTDWLTLETHGEATAGLGLGGAGAAVRIGGFGVANVGLAGSAGNGARLTDAAGTPFGHYGRLPGPAGGLLASAGIQHATRQYSLTAAVTVSSPGWRDTAALFGSPVLRRTVRLAASLPVGRFGNLNLSWIEQAARSSGIATPGPVFGSGPAGPQLYDAYSASLVNASWNLAIGNGMSVYATGYRDLERRHSMGMLAGLTWAFGAGYAAGTSLARENGQTTYGGQVQRAATRPGEFGFSLLNQEGTTPRRLGEVQYIGTAGRGSLAADQIGSTQALRAGAGGAVVLGGGSVFLADRIPDSFAVVRTGDIGGVPVLYENRPVGETRWDGRLLVPYLRSYDTNRLAIDPLGLPADVEAGSTRAQVRPVSRAGVVVDFGVRRSQGALVRLQLPGGAPVPRGATAALPGGPEVTVGREGRVYVTGLEKENDLMVTLPDGTTCHASFGFTAVADDIPTIGPVPCR